MSDRWTDKKRGYFGDFPAVAQRLSFVADQRERLGELSQSRLYSANEDGGLVGVTRFGKYERGFSTKGERKFKSSDVFLVAAFFRLDALSLKLIRLKKDGYEVINECSGDAVFALNLTGYVQLANVNVTWDILTKKYQVFVNRATSEWDVSETEEIWTGNKYPQRYEVDFSGNATYKGQYLLNGVSRNKIDVVFQDDSWATPMYYISGDIGFMKLNPKMTQLGQKDIQSRTWSIEYPFHIRKLFTLGKEEITFIYNNYEDPTRKAAIENILSGIKLSDSTIPTGWGGTNLNKYEAGIQVKNKYYYPAEYYDGTANWKQMVCEADIETIGTWSEFVSFKMDRNWVSEWRETYPRILNYSKNLNVLLVGITEIEKQEEEETVVSGRQKSYINVYNLEKELLYSIPLSDWQSLVDPEDYWFDYTQWGLTAITTLVKDQLVNAREIRMGIVEYSIEK